MIRRLIASHIGLNPETQRQIIASEMDAELCPQGTLAERIRAGGFGLGGIPPDSVATPFVCVHHIIGRAETNGR
jgi:acetate CoA/acetoacetate CoA-transferase alpha subunit